MNLHLIKIGVLLVLLLFLLKGICQQPESTRFERYSSENAKLVKGLSQNWVYTILQDQYGYIWFGTWDGLNKYDGYDFTIFNVEDGLSDHSIFDMLEDDRGNIWLGTNIGLNMLDRETQTFTSYTDLPGDTLSLYRNRVNKIIKSNDSILWLGTGGGLIKFNMKTDAMTGFLSTPQEYFSTRSNYILDICEDDHKNLWVGTTSGLIIFETTNGRSTRYYHVPGDSTGLSNDNVRCIMQEKSGNFWIGTRNGLNHYDTATRKIQQFFNNPNDPHSIGSNYIRTIYQDRQGNLWFGTEAGGLNRYDSEHGNFIRYLHSVTDKNSLSNDRVYSIYEDKTGNLWVGTYKGVNKINKYENNFNLYQQVPENQNGLSSNFIWDFDEDNKGNIWIGTSDGINIFNDSTGKFAHLKHQPGNNNSLGDNEVRTLLYRSHEKCFWFGLYGTGIDRYNVETNTFKHFVPVAGKNSLSNAYVNDLLFDSEGNLWIATGRGLNCYDADSNMFKVYINNPNDANSLCNDIVISLFEDSKKNIWVGTDRGLSKFNKSNQTFTSYFHNPSFGLNNNTIFYITEDYSGKIWGGTSGGGLIKLNPKTEEYKIYTTENGLPNNIVYAILEDDDHNLWMSTNRGVAKFYPIGENFVTYDVKDGLQSYEFNLGSGFKDKNDRMYFGGMNGFNVFKPEEIKINPNEPVIVISAFRKFNEIQPFELFDGDTILLRHDDNFFSFEVSALDFTNPSKNKYRYILENFDNDWINADVNKRVAEYKKVRPGTYTFRAIGSNNDGVWNEEGINITVIISPPWYATWYFRILVAIFLISTVWILLYRRIKNIRKKHEVDKKLLEIEKQKFELEQRALRLQMNPHFIFNSLNSIQSYILTHETEMAVTYLGKFSQLMRLILANSGNKYVPFKEELKALKYYLDLEKLRFDNKFEYNIDVDDSIDDDFIEIPPMIVQPYVENAIIHGILHKSSAGHIHIRFRISKDSLVCTITDDGVGRAKSEEIRKEAGITRKSSGMYITKARLELLNTDRPDDYSVKVTDLKDDNDQPCGTQVDLNILYLDE